MSAAYAPGARNGGLRYANPPYGLGQDVCITVKPTRKRVGEMAAVAG